MKPEDRVESREAPISHLPSSKPLPGQKATVRTVRLLFNILTFSHFNPEEHAILVNAPELLLWFLCRVLADPVSEAPFCSSPVQRGIGGWSRY